MRAFYGERRGQRRRRSWGGSVDCEVQLGVQTCGQRHDGLPGTRVERRGHGP